MSGMEMVDLSGPRRRREMGRVRGREEGLEAAGNWYSNRMGGRGEGPVRVAGLGGLGDGHKGEDVEGEDEGR
jgi:hypothetical protein